MSFDGIARTKQVPLKPAASRRPAISGQALSLGSKNVSPLFKSRTTVARKPLVPVARGKTEALIRELYPAGLGTKQPLLHPEKKKLMPKAGPRVAVQAMKAGGKVQKISIHTPHSKQRYRSAVAAAAAFIFLAFGGGIWYAQHWGTTEAEYQVSAEEPAPLFYYEPITGDPVATSVSVSLSNQLLFNTPLKVLERYLGEQELSSEEVVELRKDKLRAYLKERKSPFITDVDTIARQKHWKLILAISFAESGMGKKCRYNNCSGIGGYEPNFRRYDSVRDWMADFNDLLENKYQDWTLEKMNGVYVQPKNDNWLLATRKILSELQERGIE